MKKNFYSLCNTERELNICSCIHSILVYKNVRNQNRRKSMLDFILFSQWNDMLLYASISITYITSLYFYYTFNLSFCLLCLQRLWWVDITVFIHATIRRRSKLSIHNGGCVCTGEENNEREQLCMSCQLIFKAFPRHYYVIWGRNPLYMCVYHLSVPWVIHNCIAHGLKNFIYNA